jgi:hypothetical protein
VRKRYNHSTDQASSADIFVGGISSNLKALKANLFLSSAVAVTGIAAPIGFSFVLLGTMLNVTRNYIHCSCYEWSHGEPLRSSADKRSNDG